MPEQVSLSRDEDGQVGIDLECVLAVVRQGDGFDLYIRNHVLPIRVGTIPGEAVLWQFRDFVVRRREAAARVPARIADFTTKSARLRIDLECVAATLFSVERSEILLVGGGRVDLEREDALAVRAAWSDYAKARERSLNPDPDSPSGARCR